MSRLTLLDDLADLSDMRFDDSIDDSRFDHCLRDRLPLDIQLMDRHSEC
jgi:hypothetical protein